MMENFTCFDPADVDEFSLHTRALDALAQGHQQLNIETTEGPLTIEIRGCGGHRR